MPNPGNDPKDPLYFVTELRTGVKVITNDRTVHSFAEGFFPSNKGLGVEFEPDEFGLVGICLEAAHGYVYVTFSYPDGRELKNGFGRFETAPGSFSVQPSSYVDYSAILAALPSRISHCWRFILMPAPLWVVSWAVLTRLQMSQKYYPDQPLKNIGSHPG